MRIRWWVGLVAMATVSFACSSVQDVPPATPVIVRVEVVGLDHRFAGVVGEKHQLTLSAFDGARAEAAVLSAVRWSSTGSTVARIGDRRLLASVGSGSAYIQGATESGGRTIADSLFVVFADSIRLAGRGKAALNLGYMPDCAMMGGGSGTGGLIHPTACYGLSGTVTSRSGDIPSASAWKFTTTR